MLTCPQRRVLDFIISYSAETGGVPPSHAELIRGLGFSSKSSMSTYLKRLEERGFIRRARGRNRAIEILRQPNGHPYHAPDRIADLENTLRDIRAAVIKHAPDTLWLNLTETVVDRIDSVLDAEANGRAVNGPVGASRSK